MVREFGQLTNFLGYVIPACTTLLFIQPERLSEETPKGDAIV